MKHFAALSQGEQTRESKADLSVPEMETPLSAQSLPQKELRLEKSSWSFSKFEEAHFMVKSSHSSTCFCRTPFPTVPEICKAP